MLRSEDDFDNFLFVFIQSDRFDVFNEFVIDWRIENNFFTFNFSSFILEVKFISKVVDYI